MSDGSKPLRVALVGLGRIAAAHRDALATRDDIDLIGIDRDPEVAARWRDGGLEVIDDPFSLFTPGRLDAAIVTTPNDLHYELIGGLVSAGVHVLAEKPLALTASQAHEIVEIASQRGVVLQTASKFGAIPNLARAAALIREGAIGALLRVENVFSGVLDVTDDWRSRPAESGGGVWMDNGPHSLDVVTALGGAVRRARVVDIERAQGTEVEDAITVELELESGAIGHIRLTWNEGVRAPIVVATGDAGVIELGWGDLTVRRGDDVEVTPGGYDKLGAFVALQGRFFDAIRELAGQPGAADDHGAKTLDVIEAVYRSAAAERAWVDV